MPEEVTEAREREAAFAEMFEAELPYVWASLQRLGVNARDLEDVAQNVFLHVYRKWSTFDPSRAVRPWLFAFAVRAASDYRRSARSRREILGEAPERASNTPAAEEALASQEEARLVEEALARIDLPRRAVLVAYEIDGHAMKDVAEVLGIPRHTAYSRLRVAREEFETAIRRLRRGWR